AAAGDHGGRHPARGEEISDRWEAGGDHVRGGGEVRLLRAFVIAAAGAAAIESGSYAAAVQTPPLPAAPRETKVPQAVEKTLANGLRVIVVQKPGIPLVAARIMIKAGAAADPRGRDG